MAAIHKGEEVANPAAVKRVDISISVVTAVLLAVSQVVTARWPGLREVLTQDVITSLAVIILGVVNPILTIISSKKVGL